MIGNTFLGLLFTPVLYVVIQAVGEKVFVMTANESVYIPKGDVHRLENIGDEDLHLIEVQCGTYLGEDDIVRLEAQYDRIVTI